MASSSRRGNWYLLVSKFIMDELGFRSSVSDPCLFFRRSDSGRLMLLFLFVDDFQVSYHKEDKAQWDSLKSKLVGRFNTKDMGESTWTSSACESFATEWRAR